MWGKSAHATRWVHSGCNEGSTAGNSASHRLVQPALLRQNDQAPAYGVLVSLPVDAMSVPAVSELGATLGDSCRIVVFLKRQRRGSACLAAPPQAGCKSWEKSSSAASFLVNPKAAGCKGSTAYSLAESDELHTGWMPALHLRDVQGSPS